MSRALLKMPKTIKIASLGMFRTRKWGRTGPLLGDMTYVILEGTANAWDDRGFKMISTGKNKGPELTGWN